MTQALPKKPDLYFLQEFIAPRWDATQTVGFDPNTTSGDGVLRADTSFSKLGDTYPQFTIQTTGEESSGGATSYDYLTNAGPGQNRNGTLTAQVRVEDKENGSGYTGDSGTYSAVSAERLSTLIRQEIERICIENANGADTEFSFVGSNENHVPDETNNTLAVRREGATLSYGWTRDSL